MANSARGEATFTLGGQSFTAALTLGTLAEIESAFGVDDFTDALASIFGSGVSAKAFRLFFAAVLKGQDGADHAIALAGVQEAIEAATALVQASGLIQGDKVEKGDGSAPLGGPSAGVSGDASASAI